MAWCKQVLAAGVVEASLLSGRGLQPRAGGSRVIPAPGIRAGDHPATLRVPGDGAGAWPLGAEQERKQLSLLQRAYMGGEAWGQPSLEPQGALLFLMSDFKGFRAAQSRAVARDLRGAGLY